MIRGVIRTCQMITRKENILLRPFQHQKFIEHRRKVSKALPRIDDVSPPQRNHVYIKCKKLQSEAERHAQIERDNFILLKHLNKIMTEKRVDNFWLQEYPTFLRRIKLFGDQPKKFIIEDIISQPDQSKKMTKNQRCMACNPEKLLKSKPTPEERVPWEPKMIREFDNENRNDRIWMRGNDTKQQRCHSSGLANEHLSRTFSRQEPLLKMRSKTGPNISCIVSNRKQRRERPLTVVMKFPQSVQVALNASIK